MRCLDKNVVTMVTKTMVRILCHHDFIQVVWISTHILTKQTAREKAQVSIQNVNVSN
jgi:hypothetical protein